MMRQILRGSLMAVPTALLGLFGIAVLGWLMLTSAPVSARQKADVPQIGVIIPPWHAGGLGVASLLNMPIVDLRWAGHLVVLSTQDQPDARARLRASGYFVITTTVPPLCTTKAINNV